MRRRACGLVVAAVAVAWMPRSASSAEPANADTIEVYGFTLIAGIDKFEYAADEPLRVTMTAINRSGAAIAVPGDGYFCALKFVDETWCRPDHTGCVEYSDNWCAGETVAAIPPGDTVLLSLDEAEWRPDGTNWIHTSGRVRFWNPWNEPWQDGLNFELSVQFHRSAPLAVTRHLWGEMKRLYR